MRKLLLGTTAVAAAALFGASYASAQEAPTVRVGGYFEFTAGYLDDSFDAARAGTTVGGQAFGPTGASVPAVGAAPARQVSRDKTDFRSDMELVIIVGGKAANGLAYGAQIELQIDNLGGSGAGTGMDTDEMWGYISTPTLGTLQFGDQDSAVDQMKVTVPGFQNYGNAAGWDEFMVPNSDGTRYILADINDGNDSTKIIYLSPQFFGFDFGLSYAPNGGEGERFEQGASTTVMQRDRTTIRNELSAAVRYRGTFGGVGIAAAFGGMRADAPTMNGVAFNGGVSGVQDVTQYQGGVNVSAFGLTVGGFYSWGRFGGITRVALRNGLEDSTNWGVGATYTMGPLSFGLLYGEAERDNGTALSQGVQLRDRKQQVFSVGTVYSVAPGLEVFANYTNVDDKNISNNTQNPTSYATLRNRTADIFIIGTRLTF